MTSPATDRPRHARAESPAPATAGAPIDMPTQRIATVVTAPPPHGLWPQGPVGFPPGPYGGVPIPPAGLPVGHPPIRRDRTLTVIVAVLLGFAVVALIVLASLIDGAVGSGNDGTGSTGPGAPSPSSSSSSSSSTAEDIGAWADGGGMSRTKAISDDLEAIGDAAAIYDTSALNSACRSLRSDVESARAYGPVPDAQVQAAWSSALTHGADAATYCIVGTDSMDSDLIGRSASELDEMTDDLDDVATRMDVITGS